MRKSHTVCSNSFVNCESNIDFVQLLMYNLLAQKAWPVTRQNLADCSSSWIVIFTIARKVITKFPFFGML
jgi:hypothetical protein